GHERPFRARAGDERREELGSGPGTGATHEDRSLLPAPDLTDDAFDEPLVEEGLQGFDSQLKCIPPKWKRAARRAASIAKEKSYESLARVRSPETRRAKPFGSPRRTSFELQDLPATGQT